MYSLFKCHENVVYRRPVQCLKMAKLEEVLQGYVLWRKDPFFLSIHLHIRFSGGLLSQIHIGEFIYKFSEEQKQGGGDARLIFDTGTTVTYMVSHVYNALKIHVSDMKLMNQPECEEYFSKYCQSHRTLLCVWIMLICSVSYTKYHI